MNELKERDILGELGLHVVSESENGAIVVYSNSCRKKSTLRAPALVKQEKLVRICGPVASKAIDEIGLAAIRTTMAEAAHSARRCGTDTMYDQEI